MRCECYRAVVFGSRSTPTLVDWAASGTHGSIKEEADNRGLDAHAAVIPTMAVQLGDKANNWVKIRMCLAEGDLVSKD